MIVTVPHVKLNPNQKLHTANIKLHNHKAYYRFWFRHGDIEVPKHSENLSFSCLLCVTYFWWFGLRVSLLLVKK